MSLNLSMPVPNKQHIDTHDTQSVRAARSIVSNAVKLFSVLFFASLAPAAVGQQTADTPDARWGHLFIYFPPTESFILYGGAKESGAYLDDMWIWDDARWRRVDAATPTARGFAAAVYNAERKTIVLHGGRGNDRVTYSDLWEWDGVRWRRIDAESPLKADHHEMAYLPEEKGVLLFGGWTGDGVSGQTWFWNGQWRLAANEDASPPRRSAFGMTYNGKRNRIELYGGLWINGQYADAWAWRAGKWSKLSGPYDNSSLDHHTMFFDSTSGRTLIFGGKDYRYTMRGETRRLNAAGLIEQETDDGPAPRHSAKIGYDEERQRAVLFGGKIYSGDEQLPLSDMWVWENGAWRSLL